MTTSGTWNYNPAVSDIVVNAFGRIQIRRTELTQQHLQDAANEANMVQVELSNRQPNLWTSELYQVSLVAGTNTYTLPGRMISPMAVYLTTTVGGVSSDRILMPISTYEYAAQSNKMFEAPPTSYWYNKLVPPIIVLWPTPDLSTTYTLNLQMLAQPMDTVIPAGITPDIPYRWLDAFTAQLAARLADIYPDTLIKTKGPGAVEAMWAKAERAWTLAAAQDTEEVPMYIMPQLSGYYR